MKTTIEVPDAIYREVRVAAAQQGVALRQFVTEALSEKLARRGLPPNRNGAKKEWPVPPPVGVSSEEIWRIQALIDEEFERIELDEDDQ